MTDLAEAYDVPAEVVTPDVRAVRGPATGPGLIVTGSVDGTDG